MIGSVTPSTPPHGAAGVYTVSTRMSGSLTRWSEDVATRAEAESWLADAFAIGYQIGRLRGPDGLDEQRTRGPQLGDHVEGAPVDGAPDDIPVFGWVHEVGDDGVLVIDPQRTPGAPTLEQCEEHDLPTPPEPNPRRVRFVAFSGAMASVIGAGQKPIADEA